MKGGQGRERETYGVGVSQSAELVLLRGEGTRGHSPHGGGGGGARHVRQAAACRESASDGAQVAVKAALKHMVREPRHEGTANGGSRSIRTTLHILGGRGHGGTAPTGVVVGVRAI